MDTFFTFHEIDRSEAEGDGERLESVDGSRRIPIGIISGIAGILSGITSGICGI